MTDGDGAIDFGTASGGTSAIRWRWGPIGPGGDGATVEVRWRGKRLRLGYEAEHATLGELKRALSVATNVPVAEQQLCGLAMRYSRDEIDGVPLALLLQPDGRRPAVKSLMLVGQPAAEKLAQQGELEVILSELASEQEAERLQREEDERAERLQREEEARQEQERLEEARRKWQEEQRARQEQLHRQQQRIADYQAMMRYAIRDDAALHDDERNSFEVTLRALPLSAAAECVGNRIVAPDALLCQLIERRRQFPPYFTLTAATADRDRQSIHVGVMEFSAPAGVCYLPDALMRRLQIGPDCLVTLQSVPALDKAKSVVLQAAADAPGPQTPWTSVGDEERQALLEQTLRSWCCLNVGDRIVLPPDYAFDVVDIDPWPAASVTDVDVAVHILTPDDGGTATTAASSASPAGNAFSASGDRPSATCQHCRRAVPTRSLAMHEMRCARLIRRCPQCGLDTPDLDAHSAVHAAVTCSLCSAGMEAQQLAEHVDKQCPRRLVACGFCARRIAQVELPDHQQRCSARTAQCALCAFQATRPLLRQHLIEQHCKSDSDWKSFACEVSLDQ